MAPNWSTPLGRSGRQALAFSLVSGAITHAYHVFQYPLYVTDEGIYVQQAWSVVREGMLSPYTYFYDHAPGGWLLMAAWANILPGQFEAFGNAINTIRVLMVIAHVISVGLLFGITRRFSGSVSGAFLACFLFNFSPLAVYYQRQVLLDNLMVLWLLLSIYLLSRADNRLVTAMGSGFAFGVALVTKENALFFVPALAYLSYKMASGERNRRFQLQFWWFAAAIPVSVYILFAELKNELLPSGFDFNVSNPPANHVSLLYSIWWQISRSGPQGRNLFVQLMEGSWLSRDPYILIAGCIAVVLVLLLWSQDRENRLGYLVAGMMAMGYGFYMVRGSILLDFYVVPMIPVLAMNIGLLYAAVMKKAPERAKIALTAAIVVLALIIPGGYFVARGTQGNLQAHDLYHLEVTALQEQQIAWVRKNVPPNSRLIIDDDMWTALHDVKPYYPRAHSHFKAASDPAVRDKLFRRNWQNIDYVIMSNKMRAAMERNNGNGAENYMLDAIDQHGQRVWDLNRGGIHLAVYKIEK
ncbi:ArnT family glycosyltransferase [Actinopolymorpha alba]|uniref:ArnT family glycosyltransferase n=1 Tax=Actinopolymorpha alba TaxID=533267 RepID=UPI000365AB85|nr:glycosyltransferase family 39 protein [Actinopolymorpha alba]